MAENQVKLTKLAKCAGCGAKVGAGTLAQLLEGIQVRRDPNLLVGFDRSDDASVYITVSMGDVSETGSNFQNTSDSKGITDIGGLSGGDGEGEGAAGGGGVGVLAPAGAAGGLLAGAQYGRRGFARLAAGRRRGHLALGVDGDAHLDHDAVLKLDARFGTPLERAAGHAAGDADAVAAGLRASRCTRLSAVAARELVVKITSGISFV